MNVYAQITFQVRLDPDHTLPVPTNTKYQGYSTNQTNKYYRQMGQIIEHLNLLMDDLGMPITAMVGSDILT